MFGMNSLTKQYLDVQGDLHVNSIFNTFQGEGPFAGMPATFIRLQGCCLKCYFCDTAFDAGVCLSVDEIVRSIEQLNRESKRTPTRACHAFGNKHLVVITGGEPFVQNLVPLISALLDNNYAVQIETAGVLWYPHGGSLSWDMGLLCRQPECSIVVSPKTGKVAEEVCSLAKAWKYIIEHGKVSQEDGLPMESTQVKGTTRKLQRPFAGVPIYVQPCDSYDAAKNALNLKEAMNSAEKFGYILSIQQHKIIGVD
ncbi:7-carboxy-7-deazaguanine synthase QueE [Candidatus Microgenomates bacterium]|nr:MAG: 7-carboxy-7-deazaguanine synthase QueE [Candidatus Microgenomates bacterium]